MDRADHRWVSSRERNLRRALEHPWQFSARFGAAYLAGWLIAEVVARQAILGHMIEWVLAEAIVVMLMGFSLRGGWLRRSYQRRLDRLVALRTNAPSAWYPDPSGRHEFRFWNGRRWTDFALDNGVQCADPLPEP